MNIDPHGTTIILTSLLVVLLIVPLALLGLTIRIQNPEFRCTVSGADTDCALGTIVNY